MKLVATEDGVRFEVWAKPRSKKTKIVGARADAVEIALAAPPVDGAANDELIRALSEALDVPKRSVRILRGDTSQRKLVEVSGISAEEARSKLSP